MTGFAVEPGVRRPMNLRPYSYFQPTRNMRTASESQLLAVDRSGLYLNVFESEVFSGAAGIFFPLFEETAVAEGHDIGGGNV